MTQLSNSEVRHFETNLRLRADHVLAASWRLQVALGLTEADSPPHTSRSETSPTSSTEALNMKLAEAIQCAEPTDEVGQEIRDQVLTGLESETKSARDGSNSEPMKDDNQDQEQSRSTAVVVQGTESETNKPDQPQSMPHRADVIDLTASPDVTLGVKTSTWEDKDGVQQPAFSPS